ncbi:MAG: hypothetical protein JW880_08720 [Candidatus Thermoplasmatota archaeon]|nr:hypothetical protein [Candidatus Thermoplasmatota archaeon]
MGGDGTEEENLKLLSRFMQAGMLAIGLAGIATGNLTWIPSAFISLLVSEVPSFLARDLRLVLPVRFNFLIVFALFLHVVGGFYGFYDRVSWWDNITHAMSASLVASLGLVFLVSIDRYYESIQLPRPFIAFFIVMFTMAFGVLWELVEFATDELTGSLMQYSLDDTMLDLMFDGFAGFFVAAATTQYIFKRTPQEKFAESFDVEAIRDRFKEIKGKLKKEDEKKGS